MATSPDFHTGLLSSDEELVKRSERVTHAPIAAVGSHVSISADVIRPLCIWEVLHQYLKIKNK